MGLESGADASSTGDGTDPTVLFVDDDAQLLEVYRAKYDPYFTVRTAAGGEEALRVFDERIDFAFFDRRMPDRSGDEVVRRLRERGYETPVGFLSAINPESEPDVDHVAYLTKPETVSRVRELVATHATPAPRR